MASKKDNQLIEDNKLLKKLEDFFISAIDDPTNREWVDRIAIPCFKYKEGEQWSTAEKATLKKRGQPDTVNNQVNVTINRLVGQFVKSRTRTKFRGRNAGSDETVANVLSDFYLFISQNNKLEFEERDMMEDGITSGRGVLETFVEFDELFEPQILIKNVDTLEIFPDPKSRRYDWNDDALFICRAKWIDVKELEALYPNKSQELRQLSGNITEGLLGNVDSLKNDNLLVSKNRKRIRIVECQYKVFTREVKILVSDGSVIEEKQFTDKVRQVLEKAKLTFRRVDRLKTTINVGIFTSHIMLEHTKTKRKFFSFIPYFVYRKKNGVPYSLIFIALSLQDAINKRESKSLHLLNTNQAIYELGAVNDKVAFANELAKPDGQLEINKGFIEKFKLEKNLDLAATQMAFHNQAKGDFRIVTGVNPDALGEKSPIRSGAGIAKKVEQTDLIVAPIFDNLRRTRSILAMNVLDLIQIHYTEQKIFNITDDLEKTKVISLDNKSLQSIKQSTFDIVIDEIPDVATSQQEERRELGQMLPQILQFGPFWTKFMIKLSDLKNKESLLKELEEVPPPPLTPNVSLSAQIDMLQPTERAFFYEKMGAPEVSKAIIEANLPPTNVIKQQVDQAKNQAKIEGDQFKLQSDQVKLQADQVKLEATTIKAEGDIQTTSLDLEIKELELMQKRVEVQKSIVEIRVAKEKKTND